MKSAFFAVIVIWFASQAFAQDEPVTIEVLKEKLTQKLDELEGKYDEARAEVRSEILNQMKMLAKSRLSEGNIRAATETWEAVVAIEPEDPEAKEFFEAIGRPPSSPDGLLDSGEASEDTRRIWKSDTDPKLIFSKTDDGWQRIVNGNPRKLVLKTKTDHMIALTDGSNIYRLHRDALYGRGGDDKWFFHSFGAWVSEIESKMSDNPIGERLPGKWRWFNGSVVQFLPNNRLAVTRENGQTGTALWRITPRDRSSIIIMNASGEVTDHSVRMTEDGSRIEGLTVDGRTMWAKRIKD